MKTLQVDAQPLMPGLSITLRGPVLHEPPVQPFGERLQYGHAACFQVSPTQVAMLINRRVTSAAVVDFENGWDVLIFDDVDGIRPERALPAVGNTDDVHPRTGQQLEMVHHLPQGGFIPCGATLPDGSPHPHAGTGFGLAVVHGYPKDRSVQNAHVAPDLHAYMLLLQFAFDGQNLIITDRRKLASSEIVPGHYVFNRALGPAIPDGEDLLFGLVAGKDDELSREHARRLAAAGRKPYGAAHDPVGECYGSGVSRWRRGPDGWAVVDYVPVPAYGPDMAGEPSLVRDRDGAILMTMRGKGANVPPGETDCGLENTYEHFRVYRSTDHGQTWESIIHIPEVRAPSPVSINTTADGQIFLAANPWRPLQKRSDGRYMMKTKQRNQLRLWPLSVDRRRVGDSILLLDCTDSLGPPRQQGNDPENNYWYADHPVGGVFRLADGMLHTLLSFRLTDNATTSGGASVAPASGLWLAELVAH